MSNIIDRIALSEEILSALPKTNEENIRHYISEANKIYAEYNEEKLSLIEEMKQRRINFENAMDQEALELVEVDDLYFAIKITDPLNTAYEKLGLDEIFHHLDKFYRSNFERFNDCIIDLINIYNSAGVKISSDDFYYNEYQNMYMQAVFSFYNDENISEKLKPYFEEYYWKNPTIIRDIKLNFKSLFHRNKKTFENYVIKLQKVAGQSHKQLIKEYQARVTQNNKAINSNKRLFVAKFLDGSLSIKDYYHMNVDKLAKELISGELKDFSRVIYSFNHSLKEYQHYLEFKEVIDKVAATLKTSGEAPTKKSGGFFKKPKSESDKKIAEIFKTEQKIKSNFKRKKKNTDDLIAKISNLYEEHGTMYHREALINNINTESKILDLILFFSSYYGYYLTLSKEFRESRTEDKNNDLEQLKTLYLNPYLNLVNNLEVLKEYDIATIILDKYKLDNLKLDSIKLSEDTLSELITKTDKLCTYYDISNIKDFDIDKIDAYIKLVNILNKVE